MRRDYNDKNYKIFRSKVRNRDKCCQWPGCNAKKKLQVHHILPWSEHPILRFEVSNGITLCKMHHKITTGKEYHFASMFRKIVDG